MSILDALKALCKKVTTKDSSCGDISGVLHDIAEKWPSQADTITPGFVKQGIAVQNAVGEAPTAEEFNALLTSLRAAGIIANS